MNHEITIPADKHELDRLQELSSLVLQYGDLKERLQPFVELAKHITQSTVCEINIIGAYSQWTISGSDGDFKVIPREESVCQDTIHKDQVYEIRDLKEDQRYKDRYYVKGEPFFRFYCGVPLTTKNNFNVGSLCVLDEKAKELSETQKKQIKHLSDAVIDLLETEQKQKETRRTLEELKNSIRNLNHDIRSPINGIVGMAELMEFDDGEPGSNDEKERQEMIDVIKNCANAVVEKIDSILELITNRNTVSDPQQKSSLKKTDLSDLIQKLNNLYRPQAIQKDINLHVEQTGGFNPPVTKQFLTGALQITGNLISNSLKFTPTGGSIEVRLSPDSVNGEEEFSDMLEIAVSDTGKGMSDEQVRAFNDRSGEKIERSRGTQGERSFGIGLLHVQSMVEQLNGFVTVQSQLDKGTTFRIRLPLETADRNEIEQAQQA